MSRPSPLRTAGLHPARRIGTALFAGNEPAALGQLSVFDEPAHERLADTAAGRAE